MGCSAGRSGARRARRQSMDRPTFPGRAGMMPWALQAGRQAERGGGAGNRVCKKRSRSRRRVGHSSELALGRQGAALGWCGTEAALVFLRGGTPGLVRCAPWQTAGHQTIDGRQIEKGRRGEWRLRERASDASLGRRDAPHPGLTTVHVPSCRPPHGARGSRLMPRCKGAVGRAGRAFGVLGLSRRPKQWSSGWVDGDRELGPWGEGRGDNCVPR